MSSQSVSTLRVYVASLADYNAGRLHGTWIVLDSDAERLSQQVQAVLDSSEEPNAEDWAIHDTDGFGPVHVGEHESLDDLARVAEGVDRYGPGFLAALSLCGGVSGVEEAFRRIEDGYQGAWDSVRDWVEELMEDCHGRELEALPPLLRYAIDWDDVARELEMSGDVETVELQNQHHIFWR
jgi:antirestriction protein